MSERENKILKDLRNLTFIFKTGLRAKANCSDSALNTR
jgi:hypothetical protein